MLVLYKSGFPPFESKETMSNITDNTTPTMGKTIIVKSAELVMGMCVLSAGVCFGIISGLGQTTSTSTSSALAGALGITIGSAMFLLYSFFWILQILILRKNFKISSVLQIVTIAVHTRILNLFRYHFVLFQKLNPQTYSERCIVFIVGVLLISLGFTMVKWSNFLNYPPESFCSVISEKYGFRFGTVKIFLDLFYVAATLIICLISHQDFSIIREGTLIFALCNGPLINFYTPHVQRLYFKIEKHFLNGYKARFTSDCRFEYE